MGKNFEVISFRMPFSEPPSCGIIRVLPPSSLTRSKRLNNVARHKGQVSCDAKHPRHFLEKRTEDPSALPPGPQQPLPAFTVVRENLPRRFNFVYSGMLPRKREKKDGEVVGICEEGMTTLRRETGKLKAAKAKASESFETRRRYHKGKSGKL